MVLTDSCVVMVMKTASHFAKKVKTHQDLSRALTLKKCVCTRVCVHVCVCKCRQHWVCRSNARLWLELLCVISNTYDGLHTTPGWPITFAKMCNAQSASCPIMQCAQPDLFFPVRQIFSIFLMSHYFIWLPKYDFFTTNWFTNATITLKYLISAVLGTTWIKRAFIVSNKQ